MGTDKQLYQKDEFLSPKIIVSEKENILKWILVKQLNQKKKSFNPKKKCVKKISQRGYC